jgi:hypothetical protein
VDFHLERGLYDDDPSHSRKAFASVARLVDDERRFADALDRSRTAIT